MVLLGEGSEKERCRDIYSPGAKPEEKRWVCSGISSVISMSVPIIRSQLIHRPRKGLSPGSWCMVVRGSAAHPVDLTSAGPSQTPLLPAGRRLAAGKKLDFGVSLWLYFESAMTQCPDSCCTDCCWLACRVMMHHIRRKLLTFLARSRS